MPPAHREEYKRWAHDTILKEAAARKTEEEERLANRVRALELALERQQHVVSRLDPRRARQRICRGYLRCVFDAWAPAESRSHLTFTFSDHNDTKSGTHLSPISATSVQASGKLVENHALVADLERRNSEIADAVARLEQARPPPKKHRPSSQFLPARSLSTHRLTAEPAHDPLPP